jgi:hypothetical protein
MILNPLEAVRDHPVMKVVAIQEECEAVFRPELRVNRGGAYAAFFAAGFFTWCFFT